MGDHPNYRALNPPKDKDREDYTYAERRSELYDAIDRAGHYRNLERSTRELGNRYGVSHTTIRKDIQAILDWKADHLGENTTAELETLKTRAVEKALEDNEPEKAYSIITTHLRNLQSVGEVEQTPDKHEVTGEGGNPLEVTINRERERDDESE